MFTDILINATPYENRIALMENGTLKEFHIDRPERKGLVGNIYLGRVARVLPGIEAAFIDIGNAWRNSYSMGFSGINMGAGYGLRIKIPQLNVPIKLDLAYPILNNQDAASSKLRIHFNVGFTF